MTAEQLAEILDAGFSAVKGKGDPELTAALHAMAQKAREIAGSGGSEPFLAED